MFATAVIIWLVLDEPALDRAPWYVWAALVIDAVAGFPQFVQGAAELRRDIVHLLHVIF